MFEFDRSLELEHDLRDATYDKEEDVMLRNDNSALQRTVSIENFDRNGNSINLDDCFLERQPINQRGSSLFFGLAIVFGAVGAITSMTSTPMDTYIGGQAPVEFNSGSHLAGTHIRTGDSNPIKDGGDENEGFEFDSSSTNQNISIYAALRLLLKAFKSVPVFTYISMALSLLFLILYLNPLGYLL